jgi:hypothetical protein
MSAIYGGDSGDRLLGDSDDPTAVNSVSVVSDRPTIEQLERDLDSLIDGFIQDYSYANGKRD